MSFALIVQFRVLYALFLREVQVTFGSSLTGYLWAVLTPIAGITLLVTIFLAIDRQPPYGNSLVLFFSTGIFMLQFFSKLSNGLMKAYFANKKLLSYPAIKPVDMLIARFLVIVLTFAAIMLFFFFGYFIITGDPPPSYPENLIGAFLGMCLLGLGFGAFHAVMFSLFGGWQHVVSIITRPMFILSGIFYLPSALPEIARDILYWNPVLHIIEWFRTAFYLSYDSKILDKSYPLMLGLLLLVVGLWGERLFRWRRSLA